MNVIFAMLCYSLGHMHLIQNKIFDNNTIKHSLLSKLHIFEDYISNRTNPIGFPIMKQNGDSATSSNYIESFKDYSVKRFIILWKEFLKRPEAKLDPQYQSIEKIYKTATKALRK